MTGGGLENRRNFGAKAVSISTAVVEVTSGGRCSTESCSWTLKQRVRFATWVFMSHSHVHERMDLPYDPLAHPMMTESDELPEDFLEILQHCMVVA